MLAIDKHSSLFSKDNLLLGQKYQLQTNTLAYFQKTINDKVKNTNYRQILQLIFKRQSLTKSKMLAIDKHSSLFSKGNLLLGQKYQLQTNTLAYFQKTINDKFKNTNYKQTLQLTLQNMWDYKSFIKQAPPFINICHSKKDNLKP